LILEEDKIRKISFLREAKQRKIWKDKPAAISEDSWVPSNAINANKKA